MMSQSRATSSYAQPAPLQQAHALAWLAQQYVGQIPTFVAPTPTQVYYAPPMQAIHVPAPTPLAPLGQVFSQENHPNQPTPNN